MLFEPNGFEDAACHLAAKHGKLGALLKLWVEVNKKLTTELRQKILLATECWGQVFRDMVENREGQNLLLQLWEFAKKKQPMS